MKNELIDRQALWLALEDLRLARGMSWRDVANETGVVSMMLTDQPVESLLRILAKDCALTDDQFLRLLHWMDADWREFVRIDNPHDAASLS